MNTDAITTLAIASPWLTVIEAAERARCGPRVIYREVQAGRLRAARLGGRRELRLLPEWVDAWLLASVTPVEVGPARISRPVDKPATLVRSA
jgi:excisionase family DNA binding protein